VYVYSSHDDSKGYYCLDTDTMTWKTVESELNDIDFHSKGCDIIGRYMLLGSKALNETIKIYDMETDTMIAHILSPEFVYDGRDYQLELKEGKLTKIRFPNGGSIPIMETVLDTGDKSLSEWYGTFVPVDEQYYVYRDEYGIFLREYGKGEDGEITIELFDQ
ncbi:MAG: hypothetical protein K2N36_03805, partial [Ruminiclostridium sp.]|nr:hypothetical protein [Ruminiclostridium sp.]